MAFFSSFGQTFLVSLFVPDLQDAFNLSSSYFGILYSAATVGSALLLPWIGKQMDRVSLRAFSLSVAGGLLVSAGVLSVSQGIITLFLGLMGIRLFGQGMCMHTSQTAMARYFNQNRGKALSVAGLGLPLGEALLPVTIAFIISLGSWRFGWVSIVLLVVFLMIPVIIYSLNAGRNQGDNMLSDGDGEGPPKGIKGMQWSRSDMLRNWRFYIIVPVAVTIPFMLTGLFLYQVPLAESKGWSVELLASGFVAFAVSKSGFSLLIGPVIDKISAQKLFPFVLIPLFAGIVVLNTWDWYGIIFIYLFLIGMAQGIEINVKNALYAELYGVVHLGAIRSLMSALMVLSTAVSPALFGYMIDQDISFNWILNMCLVIIVVNSLLATFVSIFNRKQ